MDPEELAQVTEHYQSLSDEDLRDAYDVGSAAHQDRRVWEIIEREYERRELDQVPDTADSVRWDAASYRFVPAPAPTDVLKAESDPRGLGGWLLLVAFGLVVTLINAPVQLIGSYTPLFRDGTWEALTDASSPAYHSLWAPAIVFEIAMYLAFFVLAAIGLALFFRRSPVFPKLMIAFYTLALVFSTVAYALLELIQADVPDQPSSGSVGQVIIALIVFLIWVPYMQRSRRVRNTFVVMTG